MEQIFYDLYSASSSALHCEKRAYEHARKTWLCTGCAAPKPGVRTIDVVLEEGLPSNEALNFVFGCGVLVVQKSFLSSLGDDQVKRDLFVGRAFGPDGHEFEQLATLHGRCRLVVRGRENVSYRYCDKCSRLVYFSLYRGRYLWPAPPADCSIFDSRGGLIIPQSMFQRLDLKRWKKFWVEEIPVASEPRDGLGELKGAIVIDPC